MSQYDVVVYDYKVTSVSRARNGGAQITVVVGEGRNRRSITRHVNRERIGLNIDERAIPLNELYETELTEARSNLASAEAALANLKKKLEKVNEAEPEGFIENVAVAVVKTEIENAIERTELEVYAAEAIVDDAEAKLDIVRQELPLMMEFVGPGLTF